MAIHDSQLRDATGAAAATQVVDSAVILDGKGVEEEGFSLPRQLIQLFVDDTRQRLAEIRDAVTRCEPVPLQRAAHTTREACVLLGIPVLAELSRLLENKGRERNLDGAGLLFRQAEVEFERVVTALRKLSAKHQTGS